MTLEGKYLAVWIMDSAAKLFLALPQPTTASRWSARGVVRGESPHGIWLDVEALQERKGSDSKKGFGSKLVREWTVKPPLCLIRWDWIITAHVWGEEQPVDREFGFRAS
jgi:hypothetical protein